jgi:hypothetical protein
MIEVASKPLRTRRQLVELFQEHGYPIGFGTLSKLCAPTIGDGPPVAAWLGNRALHDPDVALDWARTRLRSTPRNLPAHHPGNLTSSRSTESAERQRAEGASS